MPYEQGPGVSGYEGSIPSYVNANSIWVGWQFFRPDLKSGVVQAFRRSRSAPEVFALALSGLDLETNYVVTDIDAPSENHIVSGQVLASGGLVLSCATACARAVTIEDVKSTRRIALLMPIMHLLQ